MRSAMMLRWIRWCRRRSGQPVRTGSPRARACIGPGSSISSARGPKMRIAVSCICRSSSLQKILLVLARHRPWRLWPAGTWCGSSPGCRPRHPSRPSRPRRGSQGRGRPAPDGVGTVPPVVARCAETAPASAAAGRVRSRRWPWRHSSPAFVADAVGHADARRRRTPPRGLLAGSMP